MSQSKLFAFTAVLLLCSLIFYQEHKMILEENKKHNFIAIQIIFIAQIWCNAILKAEIIFLNLICNWKIKGNPPPPQFYHTDEHFLYLAKQEYGGTRNKLGQPK